MEEIAYGIIIALLALFIGFWCWVVSMFVTDVLLPFVVWLRGKF